MDSWLRNQFALFGRKLHHNLSHQLANGSTLSGNVTVTTSVSITGKTSGVQHMIFNLDSSYLLRYY